MTTKKTKSKKLAKAAKLETLHMLSDNAGIAADGDRFINRELSWLDFNDRILAEARDTRNPLLERAKFLSITASNLDEFYVVRVASLKDMVNANYTEKDFSGLTAAEQLDLIAEKVRQSVALQYSTYTRSLIPSLRARDIRILDYAELDACAISLADEYFRSTLYPILTPMAVDSCLSPTASASSPATAPSRVTSSTASTRPGSALSERTQTTSSSVRARAWSFS